MTKEQLLAMNLHDVITIEEPAALRIVRVIDGWLYENPFSNFIVFVPDQQPLSAKTDPSSITAQPY